MTKIQNPKHLEFEIWYLKFGILIEWVMDNEDL